MSDIELLEERNIIEKKLKKSNDINHKKDLHLINIHHATLKQLDLLTIINLVAVIIGAIVGYYGMNFKKMGKPGNILSIKYPNIFVIVLSIISSTAIILYYMYNKKLFNYKDN